jgi:23S rRNA (cytosine1962-C5)-methyltransferase
MKQWRLKTKEERRFINGHPWVFSNELQNVDGISESGEWVELCRASGEVVARGFANAHSLIAFREGTREVADTLVPTDEKFWRKKLAAAFRNRQAMGLVNDSFRWLFGEADGTPGLILDSYLTTNGRRVLVGQLQAAAADRFSSTLLQAIESESRSLWPSAEVAIVLRRDSNAREREGLEKLGTLTAGAAVLEKEQLLVSGVSIECDPATGQKTGLFLDHQANREALLRLMQARGQKEVTVLDLFSYVGQWTAHLIQNHKDHLSNVMLCDSSSTALAFARENLGSPSGVKVETQTLDLLADWPEYLKSRKFDIVICDPPALIKSRKHHTIGMQAYVQIFRRAMQCVKEDGLLVVSSCSQLLSQEDFDSALSKAERRSGGRFAAVAVGSQGGDHPVPVRFPEARYLKCSFLSRVGSFTVAEVPAASRQKGSTRPA